jgi:NAD(P)-dependent dehydrogenase (short-subunit alcohol dehydrogenase family)
MTLSGKAAIVTGGASGIGQETVYRFLEEGASVVIADLNESMAKQTIRSAATRSDCTQVVFRKTDVSLETDVEALVNYALERFGKLDCMFNNAGISGPLTAVTETTIEDWDSAFAVLLSSAFLGIKHAARAMQKTGCGGTIINTSSTAGLSGGCGPAAYAAAKAGIVSLTKSAAIELAPSRIRVNAIAPGGIRTPLIPASSDAEMLSFMKGRQPWPRVGKPRDVADAAVFLASDASSFCTGTTLLVDGGLLAWGPGLFPHAQMSASGKE